MPKFHPHAVPASLLLVSVAASAAGASATLEEVIVTAQKREQSLQETPIAMSVMGRDQLEQQGIYGLAGLQQGAIPSLRIHVDGVDAGTLAVAIRGNAPGDLVPVTRDPTVGIYLDGILLARPQVLSMEVADLERIEVLRGPQGTLFGRNAIGGAVSLITRKPTGKFNVRQTVGVGNYDALTSITRIDLPEVAGVRAKLDYLHAGRDGWVKNSAPGQYDYNYYSKDGGRLALNYSPTDVLTLDYAFDKSRQAHTVVYFQLWDDELGLVGPERERASRVRAPIPLRPNYTYQEGHTLTAVWEASPQVAMRSLTGYRQLRSGSYNSHGAATYFNGVIFDADIEGHQFSQELQLIGTHDRFEWVAGLYYYREYAREETATWFALDTFGTLPGNAPNTLIDPPTDIDLFSGAPMPIRTLRADTDSKAAYGQFTWTPPVLNERLHLTSGVRYTRDSKHGYRNEWDYRTFDVDPHNWDTVFTLAYDWSENVVTYLKRSTGYRSGSVNPRSASLEPYDNEELTTWELGVKSEFWQRRLRLNADVFSTDYRKLQYDFTTADFIILETLNTARDVDINGVEIDLTALPVDRLQIGLSYSYLEHDAPLQPNPLQGGALQRFFLTAAPRHAAALTLDYTFDPWSWGTLVAHVDATSASQQHYLEDTPRADGFQLFNARLTLKELAAGKGGELAVALWGRNLTDEEYAVHAFKVPGSFTQAQAFGEPRTYGLDITYEYR